jgi:hypothetical protein
MNHTTFEVRIDRVIVSGQALDDARARRLRALIAEEMREKMAAVRAPIYPFAGEATRFDLPDLSLDTVEGERRVARAAADAAMDALHGKTT